MSDIKCLQTNGFKTAEIIRKIENEVFFESCYAQMMCLKCNYFLVAVLSQQPELELTTLSSVVVLELTTPTGVTITETYIILKEYEMLLSDSD